MKIFQVNFITDKFQHSAIVAASSKKHANYLISEKFSYDPFMEITDTTEIDATEPSVIYHETIYPF